MAVKWYNKHLFDNNEGGGASSEISMVFDESEPSLIVEGTKFRLFDPVKVKVVIERSNIQQSRLKFYLVSPAIPNVCVQSTKVDTPPLKKLKTVH